MQIFQCFIKDVRNYNNTITWGRVHLYISAKCLFNEHTDIRKQILHTLQKKDVLSVTRYMSEWSSEHSRVFADRERESVGLKHV